MPLVICCGNAARGDDAAGPLTARQLKALGIPAQAHCGEALSLIEAWRGHDDVFLVDAVVTGRAARGHVWMWDGRAAAFEPGCFRASTHGMGVAEAIGLARRLELLPARLTVYGIEARRFEPAARPAGVIVDACRQVAARIAARATAQ